MNWLDFSSCNGLRRTTPCLRTTVAFSSSSTLWSPSTSEVTSYHITILTLDYSANQSSDYVLS